MKNVDKLREKLDECGIEDYGYFGGFICLFANDPKWDALSESAKAEILDLFDQQFEKL